METIKPSDFTITFTTQLFFDTNVWLLLFGNISSFQKNDQKEYSSLLSESISRKSTIYINSNILSEFSNVLLRLKFNRWKKECGLIDPNFKEHFVGSEEYIKEVTSITILIKKILSLPNVVKSPDNFNSINIDKVLTNFKLIDFNDSYIFEQISNSGWNLVSNDGDFKKIPSSSKYVTTQ